MLNTSQKHTILSLLSVHSLQVAIQKLEELHDPFRSEGVKFAIENSKKFHKKNGKIPKTIIRLINS